MLLEKLQDFFLYFWKFLFFSRSTLKLEPPLCDRENEKKSLRVILSFNLSETIREPNKKQTNQ